MADDKLPAGFEWVDMDMIRRGDKLGPALGAKAASAIERLSAIEQERDALLECFEQLRQLLIVNAVRDAAERVCPLWLKSADAAAITAALNQSRT